MALLTKKPKSLHQESAEILNTLLSGAKKLRELNDKIRADKEAKQSLIVTIQAEINELAVTEGKNERVANRFEELVS